MAAIIVKPITQTTSTAAIPITVISQDDFPVASAMGTVTLCGTSCFTTGKVDSIGVGSGSGNNPGIFPANPLRPVSVSIGVYGPMTPSATSSLSFWAVTGPCFWLIWSK